MWDAATGREADRTFRHGGRIRALAVGPDGRWAATASEDGAARLWALRTGRPIGPPLRHLPTALCAVIDPSNRWVVTAGEDCRARVEPAPGECGGSPDQIALWAKVFTGAELDPRGDLKVLDPVTWRQLRAALREPPVPFRK
ncbi:WD40 repeat domain-containing protein [Frigoriglobus tundricola]|uniref:WD40 repeat domain-containing protein n=1 Tax=Frigoriglobus tundricola TaxID=2774151 RepID=UPI00148EBF71|nr:hypothetical protein [Frigoriglobus tundricola]